MQLGDTVDAVVLDVKEGGRRIGLSMKELEPDPWHDFAQRVAENSVLEGRVVRLMDFGAFVELEPGVEGLLHVSELGRERVRRPRDLLQVGQSLSVRVLSVDTLARRIALSRLDPEGAVLGSEEAADAGSVRESLDQTAPTKLGTNLGDLFRKAMGGGGQ